MKDNDVEPVTIEQMNEAIEEAKKIMFIFVEEQFGKDVLDRVYNTINNLNIGIDRDPEIAKSCAAYYSSMKGVYLTENLCREKKNKIFLIAAIIHEYAHSLSDLLSEGYVNAVIEEALANLFAEMSINNYIQKGNRINYISEQDNDKLASDNGYYMDNSYAREGDFTRGIMYALQIKNMDISALREYFFGSKKNFVNMCEQVLGHHIRTILTEDFQNVRNQLGVKNNTTEYLPQALKELRNILANHFNYLMDETALYSVYFRDNSIIDAIYYENKLRYKYLQKIDFSNIRRDNVQQIFSNLSVEDIQELSKKFNGKIEKICSRWGYSDFIKLLIRGWYEVNKENTSDFEEIIYLTGIPFDIFLELMKDKGITNINDIMNYISKYDVLKNDNDAILKLLSQKVGSDRQAGDDGDDENATLYFDEKLIEVFPKLNLSDEDLQKILYMYNNPARIYSDNIFDILDVLEKIDYSTLSQADLNNLFMFGNDISFFCNPCKDGKNDIGLVIKIAQLPSEIREMIKEGLIFNEFDLYDDVDVAISTLKKYGYEIENEDEILDCMRKDDYKNIKIIPNFNVETILAFSKEKEKTHILLSTCINQFLENKSSILFDDNNFDTCLMLLDENNQELLGMSDVMIRRICLSVKDKMQNSSEISSERRNKLDEIITNRLAELDNKNAKKKLKNFFNSDSSERYRISILIMEYLLKQKLDSNQVRNIIKFLECSYQSNDIDEVFLENDLENIYRVSMLFENADISCDIMQKDYMYIMGQEQMIYLLMDATRQVPINEENIEFLKQIYYILRTVKGLSEEDIRDNLFESREIADRVCNTERLIQDAVSATEEGTREGQINEATSEIIDYENGQDGVNIIKIEQ